MALPWWLPFGRVPEIAPADLAERLRRWPWPQLLDVRSGILAWGGLFLRDRRLRALLPLRRDP